ncbi:MAG: aspartate kinase [Blastocatellia bacterium]|nr:aspartate kinase [Blastocatellia bacterium]
MQVMKFGGTSVGNAERIAELARIVKEAYTTDKQIAVVVSAMSGVTNQLLASAHDAAKGKMDTAIAARAALADKHRTAITTLVPDVSEQEKLFAEIDSLLDHFGKLCYGMHILGEVPIRALDAIAGSGERLSARIVAATLRAQGLRSRAIDATELVVTDDNFGDATPDMIETTLNVKARLMPLLKEGVVPVVTGYIGATKDGVMTTLGRGGSDYSGGIFGAALMADQVIIWTDVNGFMTADPNTVKNARTIPEISYSEAAELSYYGAKVLHPKTLLPLAPAKIPLYIKNSFQPDHPGTRISSQSGEWDADLKAITSIKNISLVTISGSGMMGVPGIAAKTFSAVATQNINVLMISQSSSENNLCFIVNTPEAERTKTALRKALEVEFHHRHIEHIVAQDGIAIIAAVGEKMKGVPGIAARVFSAVAEAGVNVIAIAQGSSELNISFVIGEKDIAQAVAAMHERFNLGRAE